MWVVVNSLQLVDLGRLHTSALQPPPPPCIRDTGGGGGNKKHVLWPGIPHPNNFLFAPFPSPLGGSIAVRRAKSTWACSILLETLSPEVMWMLSWPPTGCIAFGGATCAAASAHGFASAGARAHTTGVDLGGIQRTKRAFGKRPGYERTITKGGALGIKPGWVAVKLAAPAGLLPGTFARSLNTGASPGTTQASPKPTGASSGPPRNYRDQPRHHRGPPRNYWAFSPPAAAPIGLSPPCALPLPAWPIFTPLLALHFPWEGVRTSKGARVRTSGNTNRHA